MLAASAAMCIANDQLTLRQMLAHCAGADRPLDVEDRGLCGFCIVMRCGR